MRKKQRADLILQRLGERYPDPPIPLDHVDNFTLLIAVLLSAQCTDKKVNQITPALFAAAPDPVAMRDLGEAEILHIIRPLGLSATKAKHIDRLSHILCDVHGGEVPDSMLALETLPGVGHKTASVVMSQGFGVPAFPVDTHIHRLAQRWGLSSGKSVAQTEKDLKALFPIDSWNKLHLQIIYYAREHCTARACHGLTCDLCRELYPDRRTAVVWNKA